ncbi:MAG: hypothetical protein EBW65_01975 [Gammaproteobacteria bacterium]|nr:hypothetical protein [Gammaproteobacteria bacterium]
MKAIIWLTQAQGFFVSKPRYRSLQIIPSGEGLVVTIGDQRHAMSVDAFHEWCIGPMSYCVVDLGVGAGSMHWITKRYATDLQRLRHHLVAQ